MDNQNNPLEFLEKKSRKTKIMPAKQIDWLALAENTFSKWSITPEFTLRWITIDGYAKLIEELRSSLNSRIQAASGRPSTTQLLKNLDTSINKAVEQLKIAILGKFGRDMGRAYFSEFGIAKVNKSIRLPQDRNQRVPALEMLIRGIEKYQIPVTNYSLTFFKDAHKQYNELVREASDIDGTVAKEVGNKNSALKQTKKVLYSLVQLIKANYPDSYKSEFRSWGFQKEKY